MRLLESGELQVFDHEPSDEDTEDTLQPSRRVLLQRPGCRVEVCWVIVN